MTKTWPKHYRIGLELFKQILEGKENSEYVDAEEPITVRSLSEAVDNVNSPNLSGIHFRIFGPHDAARSLTQQIAWLCACLRFPDQESLSHSCVTISADPRPNAGLRISLAPLQRFKASSTDPDQC